MIVECVSAEETCWIIPTLYISSSQPAVGTRAPWGM